MLRSVLTFFSTLAIAVMTAVALAAIMPWLSGRTSATMLTGEGRLHLESLILGVVLGLIVGSVARYE
jgi:hypothetical protein